MLDPEAGILSQSDPTDNALAAIASILDQPEIQREPDKPAVEESRYAAAEFPSADERASASARTAMPDGDYYSKLGPGPMAAIRFKWTVRADNGHYYVDETIGENSAPSRQRPDDQGRRDQVRRRSRSAMRGSALNS